jgi:eukaryotic-like serine/threonine-protein kinase
VAESRREGAGAVASVALGTAIRPGALTNLLTALARAPAGAGWDVPLMPGDRVGRFEVVRVLGRGSFGVVYEARDRELSRSVAFKAIRAGSAEGPSEQRRLAEAAARLAHPNIVHLYDLGRAEQGAYLIMELLHGQTLAARLEEGPLPLREAVRVAVEISRGVAHAHEHGVVHRDLKPSNVFVCDDGQVKVLDFGLAQVFGRGGVAGGTPAYMAPEQARGEAGDERSDVFSLGVLVAELTTGSHRPAALERLLARMREQDPAVRPATAGEVRQQLLAVQKAVEPKRLLWAAWAVAAAALIAAVGLGLRARPLPPGRLLVAIADVANSSGDRALDDVSSLLQAALEQSRRVSLLARSRLRLLASTPGGSPPARLDEAVTTAAGRRAGALALIVPAIRRAGNGYDLEVRGVDLAQGEPLFTLRERAAGRGGIPDALDRLTDRVRAALHEEATQTPGPGLRPAQVVPGNPEAWSRYAEAQRLESEGLWTAAKEAEVRQAYQRVLEIEPGFPLAEFGLAKLESEQDDDAARAHLAAAISALDRVPPKQRGLIEAWKASYELRLADAITHYDRVIAGWPQDPVAYVEAGDLVLKLYAGVEMARPYLEKAIELAPISEDKAIDFLAALGRFDEARARALRWTEEQPGRASFAKLAYVHLLYGESGPALDAARRALSFGGAPPRLFSALAHAFLEADSVDELERVNLSGGALPWKLLALRGQRRAALATLDAGAPTRPAGARGWYHAYRADYLWGDGKAEPLWREALALFALGSRQVNCLRADFAHLGDLERAARLDALWPGDDPRGFCARYYLLLKAWKTGDPEGALRGFAEMYLGVGRYHSGEILQELGRDGEAVEMFRQFRRVPDESSDPPMAWMYPRSLYLEALSLERLGRRDEALKAVDRLLRLWKRADEDLPKLKEARALQQRLAGGKR